MGFHLISNPEARITLILWVSVCALIGVLTLIALLFWVRAKNQKIKERDERIAAVWKPLIVSACVFGKLPASLPSLTREEYIPLAQLIISQLNDVEGAARDAVLKLALALSLHEKTKAFRSAWRPSHAGRRVVALSLAGHLRDSSALPVLEKTLHSRDATLSFTAAMALVRINARKYGTAVLSQAIKQSWGPDYIAKVMCELTADTTEEYILKSIEKLPAKHVKTILQAWSSCDLERATEYARRVLKCNMSEGWLLCEALDILKNPYDAPLIRPYLEHPLWSVRVQAVKAVGRLGLRQDVVELSLLLKDDTWWVQERVKEALAKQNEYKAVTVNPTV